jgi:tripartite-type tricarboxylate transporter receptor subunit TctC
MGFISFSDSWAAEKYPSRPIELVCEYAVGGQADFTNRLLARFLEKYLGTTIVPVNKPGAGGAIAVNFVANSRPDGYTILSQGDAFCINFLLEQANYKLEDLRIFAEFFLVNAVIFVTADSPWKTFQEFMDYARRNPGGRFAHPAYATSLEGK